MTLVLRNDLATYVNSNGSYTDYIFYTDLRLDPLKFQIFNVLEFVVGSNGAEGSFSVEIFIGVTDGFYVGTFTQHKTASRITSLQDAAQRIVSMVEQGEAVQSLITIRISRILLSKTQTEKIVRTLDRRLLEYDLHNDVDISDDAQLTGTVINPDIVGTLPIIGTGVVDLSPGNYFNVSNIMADLLANESVRWKAVFQMRTSSTTEEIFFYMEDATTEYRIVVKLLSDGRLQLLRYENYTAEQVIDSYTYDSGYSALMTESGKVQYSTADGVSDPAGYDAVVVGTLTDSSFENRNAIVFPNDPSTKYFDLSAYTTGPHIQNAVTFSCWVYVSSGPMNTNQNLFTIKNSNAAQQNQRYVWYIKRTSSSELYVKMVFLDQNGTTVVNRAGIIPSTNTWMHLACVVAAGRYELWANGSQVNYNAGNTVNGTATLYGTFEEIEEYDEVYIGIDRVTAALAEPTLPAEYTNLVEGPDITRHHLTADGLDATAGANHMDVSAVAHVAYTYDDGTITRDGWIDLTSLGQSRITNTLPLFANEPWTFSFWFVSQKTDQSSGTGVEMFRMLDGDSTWFFRVTCFPGSGNQKTISIIWNSNGTTIFSFPVEIGKWNHVVIVARSLNFTVYLNAVDISGNVPFNITPLNSAGRTLYGMNTQHFTSGGDPSEIGYSNHAFFSRELTATEVGYMYLDNPLNYSASFNSPLRSPLSDFQMFPRALSAAELTSLGTPPVINYADGDILTGTLTTENLSGNYANDNWHTVTLENDILNDQLTLQSGSHTSTAMPGLTMTCNDARIGGPDSTDYTGRIGYFQTYSTTVITETTEETTTTVAGTPADWQLKLRINEI